ncbi:MAG: redoxin domain-containing protein [Gammaproteobacteria bacterium]|nr:MAG: redoxin domain-containing protein [Gammaproteobacteria bacterium]
MGIFSSSLASELDIGIQAPQFELSDQVETVHELKDYLGKWVVIYFYPKDDTPGCIKEACAFRDDIATLQNLDVQVIGISVDTTESHGKFADKYSLQFPLLADIGGKVASSYGSLTKLGPLKLAKRHTFIIDSEGKLAKIYRSVKPATHSDEIIAEIKKLQN